MTFVMTLAEDLAASVRPSAAPAVALTTVPVIMRALSDAISTAAFALSRTVALRKLDCSILSFRLVLADIPLTGRQLHCVLNRSAIDIRKRPMANNTSAEWTDLEGQVLGEILHRGKCRADGCRSWHRGTRRASCHKYDALRLSFHLSFRL